MQATRIERLTSSLVRDILAVATRPGMISFAGGLPAEEGLFRPQDAGIDLNAFPDNLWQYGMSEGEPALREWVAQRASGMGLECSPEQVLILSGSQQGIDLVAKLLVDESTDILVESPAYLAALQVFRLFGARMHDIRQDEEGAMPSALAAAPQARFAYFTPTFQNPTGRCATPERRAELAGLCDRRGLTVFEDDPYRDLSFDAPPPAPLVSHLAKSRWIYQGSFSKTLSPGLRLGYLVAHPDLITPLVRLKQAADLHTNRLSQFIVLLALQQGLVERHVASNLPLYRERRDAMHAVLQEKLAGEASWVKPSGGLFFWLQLQRKIDGMALLQEALERGLAFMPGDPFFAGQPEYPALRLNFSHSTPEEIRRGVAILAELLGR
ncbi:DNA-binding transcriptional regulator, MocR family, contains an aminotransferase domain [Formivibrio citricus]|uniref:Putative 8-amino-7-oxononanoate synthase n=1 Tax=Formivibrio citricus TaxID=83765 RepID=A0A1I4Y4G1_9NEIS|nr:PLP-dependent aminotransferase family protein [Formivibrio citricus]SFN32885.1 DNA-binding transcriptional regulator, MocR family, contains an aminotransferase domain [Formivibrio citricus]